MENPELALKILFSLAIFIIAEYIGDFIEQDRETAINKSSNMRVLMWHGFDVYSWTFLAGFFCNLDGIGFIAPLYALVHMIQDKYLWSFYKFIRKDSGPDFKYWEDKLFYDFIGADRLLHILSIIGLYAIYYKFIYIG